LRSLSLRAANLSLLFLGRPGVGKTTAIREIARTLSDVLHKRVVIVDTSNEIGGDGDVAHPAIGGARRMQVADASKQHNVMVSCVGTGRRAGWRCSAARVDGALANVAVPRLCLPASEPCLNPALSCPPLPPTNHKCRLRLLRTTCLKS
jgi:hypothetical protein